MRKRYDGGYAIDEEDVAAKRVSERFGSTPWSIPKKC